MVIDKPAAISILNDGTVSVDFTKIGGTGVSILVDPATVAAIAQAAVDYYKNKQVGDWQNSVSDKLDLVINKLNEIIDLIHQAVHAIIENNNANWQSHFATNIRGPGATWEAFDNLGQQLSDTDKQFVADTFTNNLSTAVQSLTDSNEYKSWGFVLAQVVRIAFTYSMLALKLADGRLTALTVKASVATKVLNYLKRSVTEGTTEPLSFANALVTRKLELTSHIAATEAWCNGWVRVSDVGTQRIGTPKEGEVLNVVRIGRLSGGASNPVLNETSVVTDYDPRFGSSYYPDYPGSIGWREEEKARIYCNSRRERAITTRNELSGYVKTLDELIFGINSDIKLIQNWINS